MVILKTIKEVQNFLQDLRESHKQIALVPTMGALHSGHLSLVERGRAHADVVVMSLFVNPLQFNRAEDLENYPRELESDFLKARGAGVDALFLPSAEELYGASKEGGDCSRMRTPEKAGPTANGLCGVSRPGHFDGVVTVVAELFRLFEPDVAVFGEKDFQQVLVVEEMVSKLKLPVRILRAPLIRDPDGLALSSRNLRLTPEEREQALIISKTLFAARDLVAFGKQSASEVKAFVREEFSKAWGILTDYIEIVDICTLEPLDVIEESAQLVVAAEVGPVRLLDNVRLEYGKEKKIK